MAENIGPFDADTTRHNTTVSIYSSLSPVWPSTQTRREHPQWMWITVLRVRYFSFSLCLAPPLSSLSVASPFHSAVTEPPFFWYHFFTLSLLRCQSLELHFLGLCAQSNMSTVTWCSLSFTSFHFLILNHHHLLLIDLSLSMFKRITCSLLQDM